MVGSDRGDPDPTNCWPRLELARCSGSL